ncbi:hypothetical protein FQA39_LY04419 [Lamprigera yunnana]|nr:hypothetical protein FQA39_LY04419 [Lamprigera yunnana]
MALVLLAAVSYQCTATWKWIREKTCRDLAQEECHAKQTSICISHSLPDLQTEPLKQEYVQEHKDSIKKVLRQTTLPIVPTRHQTFQRQLSHRLDIPSTIQFSICSLEHRSDSSIVGLIKPELYKKDLVRQSSNDSSGGAEMEYCGKLHFALRYDKDVEGLVVKVLESRDLPIKDVTGSSDPYVKLYLLPDRKKKYQTKVHRKNLNPVFNETFIFSLAELIKGQPYIVTSFEIAPTKYGNRMVTSLRKHSETIKVFLPDRFKLTQNFINSYNENTDNNVTLICLGSQDRKHDLGFN